jgi:predicted ATP-grasp superfamily ATP-dependent carboligase
MRKEGGAMLSAAVDDLLRAGGATQVTVLLGTGVPSPFERYQRVNVRRLKAGATVEEAWKSLVSDADAALVIAPETAGILRQLLLLTEEAAPSGCRLLNLGSALTEVFSDKTITAHWLLEHNLPTPDTVSLTDLQVEELLSESDARRGSPSAECPQWVLKPRDGAGSDRVQLMQLAPVALPVTSDVIRREEPDVPAGSVTERPWILQRFLAGVSCSIGIIGRGTEQPVVLPAVIQQVSHSQQRFTYCGGVLPAADVLEAAMRSLADQLAAHLPAWSGYLGIDAICDSVSGHVQGIVDVNPRLCTSFVAYRYLADRCLLDSLLVSPRRSECAVVADRTIRFDLTGRVDFEHDFSGR